MARSIPLEKGCCAVAHGRTPADFVLQEGDELVILAESLDTLRDASLA